jgi:uncharacterized membrane protein YphA (DoxX/SURF4 family)
MAKRKRLERMRSRGDLKCVRKVANSQAIEGDIIAAIMTLIVEIAAGILLAVGILWLLLRIFYSDDDEPGNYPP